MLDGHETAQRRSIALHALIAERLDDALLARTRARLEDWLAEGAPASERVVRAWLELLDGPPAELRARLVEDSETMRDLRQCTPFAGVVAPRERWRLIRMVR